MKHLMAILVAVGFVLAAGGAAQAELVAWYTFDESGGTTAGDSSGSATVHNATLFGSNPAFAPGAGKFDGAVWLPGVNEYIQAADHGDFEFAANESFTASLWYKRNGNENDQGLITKGYADNPRKANYYLLQTRNSGFTYDSRPTSSGSPRTRLDAGGNHGDNQWHHFAVVRDSAANELRLYLDNDSTPVIHNMGTGTDNGDWAVGVHDEPLTIGDHLDRYTQGHFDDIGIWKGQALTPAEIDTIYNGGIAALAGPPPPPPPPPAGLLVDLNGQSGPNQSGYQSWVIDGSSSVRNENKSFAFAGATDGTVEANLRTTTNAQGRNYGIDELTDPGSLTIPDVWRDQFFFNNNTSGSMTLALDDLKAGEYTFTSYHYADNLRAVPENDEGTASVFVNGVDTTLDVTFISGLLSTVSGGGKPSAADLDAFGTLSMTFTVPNDGDTVTILYDDLTGGDTFGLNGFELASAAREGDIPEPATVAMLGLALTGLGAYVRKRRREAMKQLMAILVAVGLVLAAGGADAAIVTSDLSLHYRADDVDNLGNPGTGATTTLVNLASPGTHDGTIVGGSGVVQNAGQTGTAYEYGVALSGHDATKTHISTSYRVGGGVNKVAAATWEYWLRADTGPYYGRGALYGEFEASGGDTRHYLTLQGIGTGTRHGGFDEWPPGGGTAFSDSQLFDTGAFTQVVATKDGNTMTYYKDGVQVGGTKTESETWGGGGPITQTLLGLRSNGNSSFEGQFNVIRVYDAVLTSTEIQQNFDAEQGPPPPPPPPSGKIDPAELSATANTSYPYRTPNAAVNGSGLDDVDNPTTHTDAGGHYVGHWTSGDYNHGGGVEADEWLVVDLGGERDLAEMRLWSGFNDRSQTRNPTRRNLERFDLYYANSATDPGNPLDNPGNWTLLLDDQAVPDPDTNNINVGGGNNDLISVLDAGVYSLAGTTATHLGLFDLQNGGQDGWTGRHTAIAEIEVFETVAPDGDIPEPATMAMLGLALTGLGAYARKRRREAMKHLKKISAVLVVGSLLAITSVCGAAYYDLTGDNVDINSAGSWYSVGGGGNRRAGIGHATTGLTGYLNTTYTDGTGKPLRNDYWDIKDGHVDFQNGANLSYSQDLKLNNPSDETAATMTLNPGSFFENTKTDDRFGLSIGYNNTRGTFIVNNGGTLGARTDVNLGGTVAGANGNTSNSVGVFKVVGDGGTIGADDFRVSRYSKVIFELDDTGISTIDVGGPLQIWDDGGSPAGNLIVDTSAFLGQQTVDLFSYGSLSGMFGTVEVLGSELLPGNGTDPGTYDLVYGNGRVTMTYNNPGAGPDGDIPEPASAVLVFLGLGAVASRLRRRLRVG